MGGVKQTLRVDVENAVVASSENRLVLEELENEQLRLHHHGL